MNESQNAHPIPKWYWFLAGFALLWNLMGCAAFLMELFAQDKMMETWTDQQKEWARSFPSWIYYEYAIAVSTGIAGSICLLMRNSWSIPLFGVCSVAVVIQMVYTMIIAGGIKVMGASAAVMPALVILFSIVFLWFAITAKGKGWFHS